MALINAIVDPISYDAIFGIEDDVTDAPMANHRLS